MYSRLEVCASIISRSVGYVDLAIQDSLYAERVLLLLSHSAKILSSISKRIKFLFLDKKICSRLTKYSILLKPTSARRLFTFPFIIFYYTTTKQQTEKKYKTGSRSYEPKADLSKLTLTFFIRLWGVIFF